MWVALSFTRYIMKGRVKKTNFNNVYHIILDENIDGNVIHSLEPESDFQLRITNKGQALTRYSNGNYIYKWVSTFDIEEGKYDIEEVEGVYYFDKIRDEARTTGVGQEDPT